MIGAVCAGVKENESFATLGKSIERHFRLADHVTGKAKPAGEKRLNRLVVRPRGKHGGWEHIR